MGSIVPDTREAAADADEQLDVRLAELLHIMHRNHLSLQESQVS